MSVKKQIISNGADLCFIKNSRFNTTLVSFNFYMPLRKETVAPLGLLPFVLTTCGKEYPDFSSLNFKLNKLYGAELTASTEKVGDYQLIKMSVSVINDKFTLDNETLTLEAVNLLLSLIFNPKVTDGEFHKTDVQREKRKAIEHIKAEFAEKRVYAKKRLIEEMYEDEPFGLSKCGTIEDVNKITGKDLYNTLNKMLSEAYLRVNVISSAQIDFLGEFIKDKLSQIDRSLITDVTKTVPTKQRSTPKTVTETEEIAQGKLVMGFSCPAAVTPQKNASLTVTSDIFGGGPYSKLFLNVREKLSLCYYCAARTVKIKGLLTVESGIEKENAERANRAILEQLRKLKNGEISEEELDYSKKAIKDSLYTYNDSQNTLEAWYGLRILDGEELLAPEDVAEFIEKVTADDVCETAREINLSTVYKLLPKE